MVSSGQYFVMVYDGTNRMELRYANNSNYKNDTMIRKEAYVHQAVMDELRRVIEDSEVAT